MYLNRVITLRSIKNTIDRLGLLGAIALGAGLIPRLILNWWRGRCFTQKGKGIHLGRRLEVRGDVQVGSNVAIENDVVLWGTGPIIIGDDVYIGHRTFVAAQSSIHIGAHTAIAANCYIVDADHGIERGKLITTQAWRAEPVIIGEDVWLGAHVVVLRGSVIGNGAVIGANSVVKGYIPDNAIAVGSPAKVISIRESARNE